MLLNLFHRCVGDVEFARPKWALSIGLEDRVEERGRLMVASWSARTSSRRTSESDMRGCESFGSRISMNLEGVSRILWASVDDFFFQRINKGSFPLVKWDGGGRDIVEDSIVCMYVLYTMRQRMSQVSAALCSTFHFGGRKSERIVFFCKERGQDRRSHKINRTSRKVLGD